MRNLYLFSVISESVCNINCKIRNKMKKTLSLMILLACGANSYAVDSSRINAYTDLAKAQTKLLLAQANIYGLNAKDKLVEQFAKLNDKINGIENKTIKGIIDFSKETTNSLIAKAKDHPNACIAAGITAACFVTYRLYKKFTSKKTSSKLIAKSDDNIII